MENTNNNIEAVNSVDTEEQKSHKTFCWSFLKARDEAAKKAKKTAKRETVIYICVLAAVFALLCVGVGLVVYLGLM